MTRAERAATAIACLLLLAMLVGPCERVSPRDADRIRATQADVLAVCSPTPEAADRAEAAARRLRSWLAEAGDQPIPLRGAGGVVTVGNLIASTVQALQGRAATGGACRIDAQRVLRVLSDSSSGVRGPGRRRARRAA